MSSSSSTAASASSAPSTRSSTPRLPFAPSKRHCGTEKLERVSKSEHPKIAVSKSFSAAADAGSISLRSSISPPAASTRAASSATGAKAKIDEWRRPSEELPFAPLDDEEEELMNGLEWHAADIPDQVLRDPAALFTFLKMHETAPVRAVPASGSGAHSRASHSPAPAKGVAPR